MNRYTAKLHLNGKTIIANLLPEYWSEGKYLQCTGLKDSEGKYIFEGDILSGNYYPYKDDGKINYVGVVEWDDEYAGWYEVLRLVDHNKRGISDGIGSALQETDQKIVIGDIVETPELLLKPEADND